MTFKVIATGNNIFYGKKGEKKLLGDYHVLGAIRNNWIENKVEYIGKSKFHRGEHIQEEKVGLPIKKIDVLKQIEMQTNAYHRIIKELDFINKKRREIINLIKGGKENG